MKYAANAAHHVIDGAEMTGKFPDDFTSIHINNANLEIIKSNS